ncbi:anionic trypsin-2-like [Seriola dumerili]|uniref:anionic trypsin-2-like n=1 Tax=Seriola dumerili TaxID=41447 RepID=UPI000BBEE01E|nr:anionic trypsin-2-like [Seriola dumerili]
MTAMASLALLYFLLWVGVTVSTPVDVQKRIVHGVRCGQNDRLYHVKLRATDGTFCGGSLISDEWILTAAHCWEETMYADVNIHPGNEMETIKITRHEIYTENSKAHDIMLLKLEKKPKKIHKIDLPDCSADLQLRNLFHVAGHGLFAVGEYDIYEERNSENLLCGDMRVVDCSPLRGWIHNRNVPFDNWVCADGEHQVTAAGDSGGGAVFNGKIYAVISGYNDLQAFRDPCEFSRVCAYMHWIQSIIGPNP